MGPCITGVSKLRLTPNPAHCLLFYGPWTRNHFHIFRWLKRIFLKNNVSQLRKLYEIQNSASIKEFDWNTAMFIGLHIVCGSFHTPVAQQGGCEGHRMAHEAYHIYRLALYRRSLPTSGRMKGDLTLMAHQVSQPQLHSFKQSRHSII